MNKVRHILYAAALLWTGFIFAQSPGGISTNNKMWVKADNGVTTAGTTVTQWQELSGAGVTGNFTVQTLQGTTNTQSGPTFLPAGINFNPYLSFNGSTNSLSSINNFLGTSLAGNSNVTVFQVLNLKGGIVWLKWENDFNGTSARLGFENSAGRLRFDFPKAVPASAGQNIGATSILNKHTLSTAYVNVNTSVNRLNGANDQVIAIPGPGSFTSANTKIVLGNELLLNLPCQIDLAEVIIYSNTLTTPEINKIESYLAVKYGFTLNQLVANNNNYTATNGTTTWDRALHSGYSNNITGIGRDDATALSQKQSKSINPTALITLFNGSYPGGSFPTTNAANTNSFGNDYSYLLAGDNGADTSLTICSMNNRITRMARVWKVQNTGSVGNVTVTVDNNLLPCVKNMLVSTDPTFPDNLTIVIPMTSGAYKYAVASLTNGQYFTFASDSLQVPQLINAQACPGNSVTLTIQNPQSCASYQWYGSTTGGTPLATGTSVTINPFTTDTTLYVSVVGPGNCLFDSRTPVSITQINVSAPVVNGVSVCLNNSATLQVQNPQTGTTYTWHDAATGGNLLATGTSYTTPTISTSTTFYVQATSPAGCTSIRTAAIVSLYPSASAPSVVSPVSICPGTAATLQVQPITPGYTYAWYSSSTGGTTLANGAAYTTPVLNANQTYYVEAFSNNGCVSATRTAVQVNIDPPPAAPSVTSPVNICPASSASLQVQSPQAGITYQWYATPGGALLATGTSYTTGSLSAASTFYVTGSNATGCESGTTPVQVALWSPLSTPRVTVADSNLNSITYTWQSVPDATGYLISVDGINYTAPSSGNAGTTHVVTGLNPSQTVTLYVIATQTPACRNSRPGTARGTTWPEMTDVFVPTGFTPNNDGRNDVLRVIGTTIKKMEFGIYNRWGERIFYTTDIRRGWDGTIKGIQQPTTTYAYYLKAELIDGSVKIKKGTITLIR
ncbi:MAG: gliding motility-associated C-terminal domain-containing protein [Bacteroidota bacterium]